MEYTHQNNESNRISRRTALRLTVAGSLLPFLPSCSLNSEEIKQMNLIRVRNRSDEKDVWIYLELTTNSEVTGYAGPLFPGQAQSLEKLLPQLRRIIIGKDPREETMNFGWIWSQIYPNKKLSDFQMGIDPLTGETIWNKRRSERHTPTGKIITGISQVDNALWDIKGKLSDQPVFRLLGGKRENLRAYMSLRPDDDIKEAIILGKELYDKGQTAQKWFFRYGPPDGKEGFKKITGLAEGLRTELGEEAMLMFDFAVGQRGRCDWDVDYAIKVANAILPFNPTWLEEPFSPEEIESYRRLKGETNITLATGEHTYTRWNIRPFLEEKLVNFVQCDPEWCGGISELLEICKLADGFDHIQVIPHGHHILAASHVVASQPESLCPMVEYGPNWVIRHQSAQTHVISPEAGNISTPVSPGLGPSLDWEHYERVEY
jgi:L-alanine-DL-glutamate epimerase-like enolase superfamily enzyme